MRIGVDIRHLAQPHPTGVGRYTIETIRALAQTYPKIVFILFASARASSLRHLPTFSEPNILVEKHYMPSKLLKLLLKLPIGMMLEDFLYRDIDAWWLPNVEIFKTRLPYFLTVHDVTMEILGRTYSWKRRAKYWLTKPHALMQGAQTLFCVSKSTAQDVQELIPGAAKTVVTPLGVSEKLQSRKQPWDDTILHEFGIKAPYFLSLCTLEPRKNLESVIEGFLSWKSEPGSREPGSLNTKLVLAGISGWKNRRLKRLVKDRNDILVLGYLSEKEKSSLLRHCEVLLFPSFYEGFGLPVLEATALGKPVITSANSSLTELDYPSILFIDAFQPSDITAALRIISTDSLPFPNTPIPTWHHTAGWMQFHV